MIPIIEMADYTLAPRGTGQSINGFYFALAEGDVCAIEAQNPDDALNFLRAVATLVQPAKGIYRFMGKRINLNSHEAMLECKSQIGYIGPEAALISNMTVHQNILFKRYYYENDLTIDLDDSLQSACDAFGICSQLDKRPADLNSMERQIAIVIREIGKQPHVLLIDKPEDYFGHPRYAQILDIFTEWIDQKKPVVVNSFDRRFIRRFANRKVLITNSTLTTVDV